MSKNTLYTIFIIICAILYNHIAFAQCSGVCSPNLYEEFNYTSNTALYNAVGGSGWLGGWDVQNGITTVPGYSISSGSLSSGSIKAFNNRLSGGLSFLTVGRIINTSNTSGAPFAGFIDSASLIGLKGTTLYWSVLLSKNGNNTQQVKAMLHKGSTAWSVSNTGSVGIGYFGTAAESKASTTNISTDITNIMVQLTDIDDLLIPEFEISQKAIVASYKENRIIGESAVQHTTLTTHIYEDDAHTTPIVGAIMGIEELNRTSTSNVDGMSEIVQFTKGGYTMRIVAPGKVDLVLPFNIKSGKHIAMNIVMVPNCKFQIN